MKICCTKFGPSAVAGGSAERFTVKSVAFASRAGRDRRDRRNSRTPDSASTPRQSKLRYPQGGVWPEEMPADMAAAFVGEVSTAAFLSKVGATWPQPVAGAGSRKKWSRERLHEAIRRRHGVVGDCAAEKIEDLI